MLPNLGYFRGISCPSQRSDGQCNRPYCQFRHAENTPGSSKKANPISLDAVNKAIDTLKNKIAGGTITVSSDSECDQVNEVKGVNVAEYKPYGAAADLYKGITKSDNIKADHSIIHQKASHKSFLHAAKGPSNKQFGLTYQKKKAKQTTKVNYTLNSATLPTNDLEYDPLCNYDVPDVTDKQKKIEESTSSENEDLPATDLIIDDSDSDTEIDKTIDKQEPSVSTHQGSIKPQSKSGGNNPEVEVKSKSTDPKTTIRDVQKPQVASVIDLTLWESDSDRGKSSIEVSDVELFGNDSDTDGVTYQPATSNASIQKLENESKKSATLHSATDIKPEAKTGNKETKKRANTKESKLSKASKQVPKKIKKDKVTPTKDKHASTNASTKNKHKRKNSSSISDKPKKIKATFKSPNIDEYVDKSEIERLDEELNGINTFEECFQIYKESFTIPEDKKEKKDEAKQSTKMNLQPEPSVNKEEKFQTVFPQKSTRKAHVSATGSATALQRVPRKAKRFPTPAQAMLNRLKLLKEEQELNILKAAEAELTGLKSAVKARVAHLPSRSVSSSSLSISRKHRLAQNILQVSEPQSVLTASSGHIRKPFVDLVRSAADGTTQGTVTKGCKRVAHVQKSSTTQGDDTIERPRIQPDRHSKVPTNIRQRYLSMFIDECLRIFKQDHRKAYQMAEMEENQCKERSNMKSIYLSLAASTLKKLRSMETGATLKGESVVKTNDSDKPASGVEAVVFKTNGLRVAHGSNGIKTTSNNVKSKQVVPKRRATTETNKAKQGLFSILQREESSNLSGEEVYEKMCNYIMTEEQLEENGYPRPGDIPGNCIFMVEKPKLNKDPTKKICARCGKEFVLYKGGHFAKQDDECIYHWGRAYITKVGSTREKRYNCCQNTVGSEGCSVGETHVHQDNKLDTSGYVQTLDKSSGKTPGIFSLDCEMVHSTVGLELVRVSVVNYDCNVVYDTFVMPEGKVLDYNTRWSGVTDKDLVGVTTTLRDVQAQFLSKFSSDTILIGHSLESDLTALRIIHSSVVDTSVVFPHRLGPPFKRALRNLMSEFLGVLIQNADDEGHDSSEDASACIKLMKWKIEEDMKVART